ncbi:hypothetical protein FHG87_001630 [Trinorchestia longiramus]|nr:hypothetical protein FHG87_001630 [Trinorchestia longiramus]
MSEKCMVTQCCCGCTLRTGALATAIFCLVSALINAIFSVVALVRDKEQTSWFSIIVNIVVLIIAILLFVGVTKEKPNFIRIWIYVEIVLVILTLISSIVLFFKGWHLGSLIVALIIVAVMIYLIIVVRSFVLQLESGGGAPGNTV